MSSELQAIHGQGAGNVLVTLTQADEARLVAEVEVNVHGMPANKPFAVE